MKIKVQKSSDAFYWYAKHTGEVFLVEYFTVEDSQAYCWVRSGDLYNTINFVLAKDCVDAETNQPIVKES